MLPLGTNPVNVALVRRVDWLRMKSSANSISNGADVSGRDALAIRPSGSPVLKKKAEIPAEAGRVNANTKANEAAPDAFMVSSVSPRYH